MMRSAMLALGADINRYFFGLGADSPACLSEQTLRTSNRAPVSQKNPTM